MPIKIIADYREILIDIFFAIIIVVGFDRFLRDFVPDHIGELTSPPIIMDSLFFFAAYFWVISHWISYHELITKYPYYRWRKFLVDIILFSVMFIIVNISFSEFSAEQYASNLILVSLLITWYSFACIWHLSDIGLRPLKIYLRLHVYRVITYLALLLLLYHSLVLNREFPLYRDGVLVTVILAMILWNIYRLKRFLFKDSRFYRAKYINGFPGINMPTRGELELYRYPIKEKIGDNGKDRIKFKSDNLPPIEIFAQDISNVNIEQMPDHPQLGLLLQIDCKFCLCHSGGTVKNIKICFDLNDEIIASVEEGIEQLLERKRHGNSHPL